MGVALAVCKKEGLIIMFWGAPISGFVNILVYLNKQANNFEKSLQFFLKLKILEISIIRSLIIQYLRVTIGSFFIGNFQFTSEIL